MKKEENNDGFCIGTVRIPSRLVLGPMAGVTDLPFRLLCKEQGAGLVCTEMISAKAILYRNKNTAALMRIHPAEHPVALQLFGSEPEVVAEAAAQIEEEPFDLFDFNMGCPVPKVVNNGEGSALLKDLKHAGEILSALVQRVKKPVMVKIRRGFAEGEDVAAEAARVLEDAGVAAISVHGRTREQYYSGTADWNCIRRAQEAVSIPIIGNGDVWDAEGARRMLEETGCAAVMIARAARGNPWIFREIGDALQDAAIAEGKEEKAAREKVHLEISAGERLEMIERHAQMLMEEKGVYIGLREMRKHIAWYTNGLPHAAAIRRQVNMMECWEEMQELLRKTLYERTRN